MITIACIVAILILYSGSSNETPPPTGAFVGVPQYQQGYQLTFGVIMPAIKFADCNIVLGINGTYQSIQAINVTNGNTFNANNITWTDLANDGIISYGDSLTVSNPVKNVTYEVVIIFAPAGGMICHQSWTVP